MDSGTNDVDRIAAELLQEATIEIPWNDAPEWLRTAWEQEKVQTTKRPKLIVKTTQVVDIGPPYSDYCVRNIVAHDANRNETQANYVPSYDSILGSSPKEQALYLGGRAKLNPGNAIAVMDQCGNETPRVNLYMHPADFQPPKTLSSPLTDRQKNILNTIRSYIPAYRKGVFAGHGVTDNEFSELQKLGMVDKRRALTLLGRNAVPYGSVTGEWR
ncbi:MAG: hypothetical protein Q8P23_00725 [bacterium]|nr:hypothetical protein [bacterium]